MKVITIDPSQFDSFANKHAYRNYYQTSKYGNVMAKFNYEVRYIGITDDSDNMVGASLLLIQDAAMKTKLAYAPRGILFDFTDSLKVNELVEALKKDLGKEGIVSLRIDPAIPKSIRDGKGNIVNINNEASMVGTNLEKAGFTYKGETLYFETEKPRWEALVVLSKDIREIYKNFDKRTRNKINKAINCGVEIYRDDKKDITELYNFIKSKHAKPFSFYKELIQNFGNNADVFYAKLNTETFVLNSKKLYEDELAKNEKLSSQFQSLAQQNEDRRDIFNKKVLSDKLLNVYKSNLIFATKILKENPHGLIVAGGINIIYDNAAYLIVEGFNKNFRSLNANYLLKWRMLCDYKNENLKYFNLNAISGNFEKNSKYAGLNEMKLGYSSMITEYIGEYEVILNNFKYNLYKNFSKK